MKKILGTFLLLVLAGCGGGGGGTTSTPTAAGTSVNLTTFETLVNGTATAGTQASFSLSGSDSTGGAYTGSFQNVSDGPTVFSGQNMTKARTLTTITRTGGASATDISTRYYLVSNGNLFQISDSLSSVTATPTSQTVPPATSTVGAFSNLYTLSLSNGSNQVVTWRIDPDFNGNSIFIISTVTRNGASVITSTEEDSFYLDPSGNPYRMNFKVTQSGVTITLSGNKN